MTTEPRIVRFEIEGMPRRKPEGFMDPMPTIKVTFDNGSEKPLFTYYPDEVQFGEGELVGLTEAEARDLKRQKDVQFLQRP